MIDLTSYSGSPSISSGGGSGKFFCFFCMEIEGMHGKLGEFASFSGVISGN